MRFEDYKIVLYRQDDGSWVAELPSIPGCYALMTTREAALSKLAAVFGMIADEYKEKGLSLPADTTEVLSSSYLLSLTAVLARIHSKFSC